MVEVLEVLGAADMTTQQAAAVLQLTGSSSIEFVVKYCQCMLTPEQKRHGRH